MKINEGRKLLKIKIKYLKDTWTLSCNGKDKYLFGDDSVFRRFLMRIKASDVETEPKSKRNKYYIDMVNDAKSGKDNEIWVYDNVWNKLPTKMFENVKFNKNRDNNYDKEINNKRRELMRQNFRERKDELENEKPVVFDIDDIQGFDKDGSLVIEKDNKTYNVDSRDGDKLIVSPGRVSITREEKPNYAPRRDNREDDRRDNRRDDRYEQDKKDYRMDDRYEQDRRPNRTKPVNRYSKRRK